MPPAPAPTVSDVSRIAAIADPVLRNLQITQCYHELAAALAERLGREANWCTFATWASKQAGSTIRKEDMPRTLEAELSGIDSGKLVAQFAGAARRIGVRLKQQKLIDLLWRAFNPESSFTHAGEAVARGNLKVFAEIGHEFARFIETCLPDTAFDQAHLDAFLADLRPGPPPDGQDSLRQAFESYYLALFETQPGARSERLLLGNLLIGFHEQTRLQPEIVAALEAPVIAPQDFARNLLQAYYPRSSWLAGSVLFVLRAAGGLVGFDAFIAEYLRGARRQAQFLVTRTMMSIEVPPGRRLRLGEDLAQPFPASLQHIADPDLAALLARIDPTPDSTSASGAVYWGDLPDRLHFIADLFRAFQTDPELFSPPFTPDQVAALRAGRLPTGRL